ncbi:hypothetical protein [Nannocystis pusilla]|uniref:hypothetical protein n=1 Tax=Nannocystis pusilla TaxID=889268 RepID=UPI003B7E78B2
MQRIQKVPHGCNIKLDSLLSDISGASGLAINCGIIAGEWRASTHRRRVISGRRQRP